MADVIEVVLRVAPSSVERRAIRLGHDWRHAALERSHRPQRVARFVDRRVVLARRERPLRPDPAEGFARRLRALRLVNRGVVDVGDEVAAPKLAAEKLHSKQTEDHGEERAEDHDPLDRGQRAHGAVDHHAQRGKPANGAKRAQDPEQTERAERRERAGVQPGPREDEREPRGDHDDEVELVRELPEVRADPDGHPLDAHLQGEDYGQDDVGDVKHPRRPGTLRGPIRCLHREHDGRPEDAEEDEVAEPVIFDDLQPDGLLLRLLMGVHEIVQSLHRL